MSWYGDYGNVEGIGHSLNPDGARFVPGNNISATDGSTGSYINKSVVANHGYAVGVPTSVGVQPASADDEIYGIIPKGGAQKYNDNTVYTAGNTASTDYRYLFRIEPGKPGERFEVAYNTNTDSSPSVGERVVNAGGGSVHKAPAVASNGTFAAGELRVNWVCVDVDTTNKTCIIERL